MKTDLPSYSSSLGRLEAHVGFKVKYCHEIFRFAKVKNRCCELLHEAANVYDINIKELGIDMNHAHLIVDFGCKQSVAEVAKKLKGYSGRKLLEEFPYIKRKYFWGSGLWGGQIYFDSIGGDREQKTQYVRNQGKPKTKKVLPQTQKQTMLSNFINT